MDDVPNLRRTGGRTWILGGVALLCVVGAVTCGTVVWRHVEPTVDAMATAQRLAATVFKLDPDAELLRVKYEASGGRRVVAFAWQPRRELTRAEIDAANDRLSRHLWPSLEPYCTSMVLAPMRETERAVGTGTMTTRIGYGRKVYGRPLDDDAVDSVLDD